MGRRQHPDNCLRHETVKSFIRRTWLAVFASALFIAIGGYVLWRKSATYVAWELQDLQREFSQRNNAITKAEKNLKAEEIAALKIDFDTWQNQTRIHALQIAAKHSGTMAEAGALLMVSTRWPDSVEGRAAIEMLPKAALSLDIREWITAIERVRVPLGDVNRWQPLASQLVLRADKEQDHPDAAWLLCKALWLIAPDHYAETTPLEFAKIAERIRDRYAANHGISNFCELVGGMNDAPTWGHFYEPHVREILRVNQDRMVRCSAQFSLASIVQSAGIKRQAEAQSLLRSFLDEFNGEVKYDGQPSEQLKRQIAKRNLEAIEMHGLGAIAPKSVGLNIEGHPMSLEDYRGKVVLLSFWATWCAPCMDAIEHEKELVEHFDPERFAIVGVNGDPDPSTAIEAVAKYGVTWSSFQNKRKGGKPFESEWHVGGWPTFYLINSKGVIERRWTGLPPQRDLKSAINDLLKD